LYDLFIGINISNVISECSKEGIAGLQELHSVLNSAPCDSGKDAKWHDLLSVSVVTLFH